MTAVGGDTITDLSSGDHQPARRKERAKHAVVNIVITPILLSTRDKVTE